MLFALKMLIAVPVYTVIFVWFALFFPVSIPAWLALEIFYGRRYGSGIRPVKGALRTEVTLRLMSSLACSAVAGIYMFLLQIIYDRLNIQLLAEIALGVGIAAVQLLFLAMEILGRILFHTPTLIQAQNGSSFELRSTQAAEDAHVYRVIYRANNNPAITVAFMCPCETPCLYLKMLSCNANSVSLEGMYSTRAFVPSTTAETHPSDYARGILQISFDGQSAPTLQILKWLPFTSRNSTLPAET